MKIIFSSLSQTKVWGVLLTKNENVEKNPKIPSDAIGGRLKI